MTYKYDTRKNPKRYFVLLICIAFPAAGASLYFILNPFMGIAGSVIGIWAAISIYKMLKKTESVRVETYSEGCTAYGIDGEKLEFNYCDITHAGLAKGGPNNGYGFIYNETTDKIAEFPPVFHDFETLKDELKENTPWQIYELEENETIIDRLKKILKVNEPEEDTEETNGSSSDSETEQSERKTED